MYGAQTGESIISTIARFENDVEMYGAQTSIELSLLASGLRMM